jgi:hypothetical protein
MVEVGPEKGDARCKDLAKNEPPDVLLLRPSNHSDFHTILGPRRSIFINGLKGQEFN